mmetsp:Transcript_87977/g.278161  ORF Transcript_87977/g.278161 Transcript_87977/m.278161 type:complete len:205 (-) Transcript_87977:12-626(-)
MMRFMAFSVFQLLSCSATTAESRGCEATNITCRIAASRDSSPLCSLDMAAPPLPATGCGWPASGCGTASGDGVSSCGRPAAASAARRRGPWLGEAWASPSQTRMTARMRSAVMAASRDRGAGGVPVVKITPGGCMALAQADSSACWELPSEKRSMTLMSPVTPSQLPSPLSWRWQISRQRARSASQDRCRMAGGGGRWGGHLRA